MNMSDFSVTELPLLLPADVADVDDVEEDADSLLLHPATSSATRTASAKGIRTEVRKRRNGLMNSSSLSPVGSDSLTAEVVDAALLAVTFVGVAAAATALDRRLPRTG
jgi:hypothetical protein